MPVTGNTYAIVTAACNEECYRYIEGTLRSMVAQSHLPEKNGWW